MSKLSDPEAVQAQYARSDNFDARVGLYRRYSTARPTWLGWLFDRIALTPGDRVLEVGSGTANLWVENAERMPAEVRVTLSDLSAGMLDQARARLGPLAERMTLQVFDVCRVPYPDDSFDRVIANHMLYHVADRARAIRELSRVLGNGGSCHVGTNDWTHQIEIRELIQRFEVESTMMHVGRDDAVFDLQAAAEELSACFETVEVHRRHDHLYVTEARDLGNYIRSACPSTPENLRRIGQLEAYVAKEIERMSSFHLTVAAGICNAR